MKVSRAKCWVVAAALTLSVLAWAGSAQAQRLIWLGTMGGSSSVAYDVSIDGQVVVGAAQNDFEFWRPIRWTRTGGFQDLGGLGGAHGKAYGCSSDGSVVVGEAVNGQNLRRAFRWRASDGMKELATSSDLQSIAYDVSADGSRIVGTMDSWYWDWAVWRLDGSLQYRWDYGYFDHAHGVSADGSIIVGERDNARASYWNATQGRVDIGTLGGDYSVAYACSADGSVIVGASNKVRGGPTRAFRWTSSSGMVDLGALVENRATELHSVTGNGLTAVGRAIDANGNWRAIIWTSSGGIQDLNQLYRSLLTPGSLLTAAWSISANGRYIVGEGYNAETGRYEGYLLETGISGGLPKIRGNITVPDYAGDLSKLPVTVEIRRSGNVLRRETIYPDRNGNYTILNVSAGTYDLAFQAGGTLRTVVYGVTVGSTDVTGVNVTLANGDIDGDNEITLYDFGLLVRHFGMQGDD